MYSSSAASFFSLVLVLSHSQVRAFPSANSILATDTTKKNPSILFPSENATASFSGIHKMNGYAYYYQQFPYGDGPTLRELPQVNVDQCQYECDMYGPNCVGFTFKYMDPNIPNDPTRCFIKGAPLIWRSDPLCGPNNQLCVGYAKYEYTPIPGGYQPVSPPMIDDAVLPGYPKYNLPYSQCVQECSGNQQCYAITFKQRNPGVVNDMTSCWLSSSYNRWRSDGICGIDDRLCLGLRKVGWSAEQQGVNKTSQAPMK